jgi:hypothetical protein
MEQDTKDVPAVKQPVDVRIMEGKGLMPETFNGLWRVAGVLANSGMVPKDMIGKPEAVFVACQMGMEVGLSLMASVQNIAVINGRPSIWGDSVLALVRASGKCRSFRERFEGVFPQDTYRAVCETVRDGESEPTVREFSIEDAKRADLWNKQGPWKQYPKRMLQMRARSWALRDTYGDVLKGIHITEEVMDYDLDLTKTDGGAYEAQEPAPPQFDTGPFYERFVRSDELDRYVELVAKAAGVTPEEVMHRVGPDKKESGEFARAFLKWAGETVPETPATAPVQDNEQQKPPVEAWNPYTAAPMGRYSADKAVVLKAEAEKRGMNVRGLLPREVHTKLLVLDKPGAAMESMSRVNELWVSGNVHARNMACLAMKLPPVDGGFQRPTMGQAAEWCRQYDEAMSALGPVAEPKKSPAPALFGEAPADEQNPSPFDDEKM